MNARATCLLVVLPLLTACVPHQQAARGITPEDRAEMRAGPLLVDPSLVGAVRVGEIEATRLDSGKLRLIVPLQNTSGQNFPIQIKVSFKDESGRQISGDETTWEVVMLSRGVTNHTVHSLRQKASRYHVQIRRHNQ